MKISRFIQVLAVLAIVLHGAGVVRSFHDLTHHTHGTHTAENGQFGDHTDHGHSDPEPAPYTPEGDDCELCLALGSVVLSASQANETPSFAACVEQALRPRTVACTYSLCINHPARAPPLSSLTTDL